jgi:hypothetical protein
VELMALRSQVLWQAQSLAFWIAQKVLPSSYFLILIYLIYLDCSKSAPIQLFCIPKFASLKIMSWGSEAFRVCAPIFWLTNSGINH